MTKISLKGTTRKVKDKTKQPEKDNILPAVVYGPNSKNQPLSLNYKEFETALQQAGESTLIDLIIDEKNPVKVLVHDLQKNPVSDKYIHVDFYQLDMNKKIKVEVELVFENIAAVEKASGGEIIKNMDKIEVECLPQYLIREIDIDVSKFLKTIGDVFHVKDIKLSEGLDLISQGDLPIISLQEIREEIIEEEVPAEAEGEGEEGEEKPEGEGEKAKEGEEKPEGEINSPTATVGKGKAGDNK